MGPGDFFGVGKCCLFPILAYLVASLGGPLTTRQLGKEAGMGAVCGGLSVSEETRL